jgi:hypothetical protein
MPYTRVTDAAPCVAADTQHQSLHCTRKLKAHFYLCVDTMHATARRRTMSASNCSRVAVGVARLTDTERKLAQ